MDTNMLQVAVAEYDAAVKEATSIYKNELKVLDASFKTRLGDLEANFKNAMNAATISVPGHPLETPGQPTPGQPMDPGVLEAVVDQVANMGAILEQLVKKVG